MNYNMEMEKYTNEIHANASRNPRLPGKASIGELKNAAPALLPQKRRIVGGSPEYVAKKKKQKEKKAKKIIKKGQKYSLDEIAKNEQLMQKLMRKTKRSDGSRGLPQSQDPDVEIISKKDILAPQTLEKQNHEDKKNGEIHSLLLMEAVLEQISEFTSKEKNADLSKISKVGMGNELNPRECQKMWKKWKEKINNNSKKKDSEFYKYLRQEIERNYYFREILKERTRIYERNLESVTSPGSVPYEIQQRSVAELMQDYSVFIGSAEKCKKENLIALENKLENPEQCQDYFEIEFDLIKDILAELNQTRKSKKISSLDRAEAFLHPWSDVEILNLLKGIIKFGENSWSEIMDEYNFQPCRNHNALAHKWSKMKRQMLREISHNNLTKLDWIQGYVQKIELHNPALGRYYGGKPELGRHPKIERTSEYQRQMYLNNSGVRLDYFCAKGSEQTRDPREDTVNELRLKYSECEKFFRRQIQLGLFTQEDLLRFLHPKEGQPLPRLFELHYSLPPKPEEKKEEEFISVKKMLLQRAHSTPLKPSTTSNI